MIVEHYLTQTKLLLPKLVKSIGWQICTCFDAVCHDMSLVLFSRILSYLLDGAPNEDGSEYAVSPANADFTKMDR